MPLDPDVVETLALLETTGIMQPWHDLTPIQVRELTEPITEFCAPLGGPVAAEEDRRIPGPGGELTVRIYQPDAPGPLPVVVYLHGGGWVLYDLDTFNPVCRDLANAAGAIVVAVAYRLAPEHPFPAAVDDAYATVCWAAEHAAEIGGDGTRLAVAGDSAGGNMSAVTALRCRDAGGPALAFQLVINPVTDCDLDTDSYHEFAEGMFLTRDQMRWYWDHYLSDPQARVHPWASPLRAADLSGLPPAIVYTAENDPLRDEGEAFAARLAEAGVPTVARRVEGVIHGFMNLGNASVKGAEAVAEAGAALRRAFGTS
jgi:acetyl esterase